MDPETDNLYIRIVSCAPTVVYPIKAKGNSKDEVEREIKYAKEKIKLRMIEEIINAVWELEAE